MTVASETTSESSAALPVPLAPGEPLPHRKVIRSWLIPLGQRSTARALLLLAVDYILLAGTIAGTIWFQAI